MFFLNNIMDYLFGAALFFNALLFIPQAIRIVKNKTADGVSLITFSGFLFIQMSIILHGLMTQDYLLMSGYIFSIITCSSVVILAVMYRKKEKQIDVQLDDIIEQLPGHVYWKDKNFVLVGSNTNNWKDFGFHSLEEALGKTDYDFFCKDIADKIREVDYTVITQGIEQVVEEIYIADDGSKTIYLSHKKPLKNKAGNIVGLIGYSVDVTLAKKETLDRLAILDNIVAVMPGNVYWIDRNGVYLGCNRNEALSAGLHSREEIIGKRRGDVPGSISPQVLDVNNALVLDQGQSVQLEESVVLHDGTKAVFLSNKVPLRDSDNAIVGLIGISFDITEKKKAEEELVTAKEAAEAANRSKTEFLANVSHDVKTPLSGVVGMADLIMSDSSGQNYERSRAIYLCGMQMLRFFNSCLELSQFEMMEWVSRNEVFSVTAMLNDLEALLLPSAQLKKLQFNVIADSDLPVAVLGHRGSIYRVLLNIIGNALKFTTQGSVSVRGFVVERTSSQDVRIGFSVADTGIGIPEDKCEVIFEKMSRLTPSYEGKIEGSGIGLYIVDQYVKRMNGEIRVDSVLGEGSTFTVFIPLKLASEEELDKNATIEPAPLHALPSVASSTPDLSRRGRVLEKLPDPPRILLVEDNSLIQQATQSLLNRVGFAVDIAGTGAEAIEKFTTHSYDLIYMDIGLPDQDGYAVAERIRSIEKFAGRTMTPIIALTAHGAMDVETQCTRAGMQHVLSKPLTREQAQAVWSQLKSTQEKETKFIELRQQAAPVLRDEKIIDLDATIALLGSHDYALELLGLWHEMLIQRFLPAIKDFVKNRDHEALRHELHTMLGSLCYVKTPLLNQAVLELQTAARHHPNTIDSAYEHLLEEAERFIAYYHQKYV